MRAISYAMVLGLVIGSGVAHAQMPSGPTRTEGVEEPTPSSADNGPTTAGSEQVGQSGPELDWMRPTAWPNDWERESTESLPAAGTSGTVRDRSPAVTEPEGVQSVDGKYPVPARPGSEAGTGMQLGRSAPEPSGRVAPAAASSADVLSEPVSSETVAKAPPVERGGRTIAGEWVDPMVEERRKRLEAADEGFIERQADQSETLILLNRQLEIANAINDLMEASGPDTMIEIAPGEFRSFADWPAAQRLRQSLEEDQQQARLNREKLAKEMEDLKQPEEPEVRSTMDSTDVDLSAPFLRGDGTPAPEAPSEPSPELDALKAEIEALRASLAATTAKSEPSPPPASVRMSLREVYGLQGDLVGVLEIEQERVRVRKGDMLPGGVRVKEIGPDTIKIEQGGQVRELNLRS